MQLIIHSPHVQLSADLQEQIRNRFEAISKLYDRIIECKVLLKKEKDSRDNNHIVEASIFLPGNSLFATEREQSFEKSLHKVMDDLVIQLHRHKGKREIY